MDQKQQFDPSTDQTTTPGALAPTAQATAEGSNNTSLGNQAPQAQQPPLTHAASALSKQIQA